MRLKELRQKGRLTEDEKKEKDFAKDGKLNDRSLNRVDIVKEIAKFANTACFGKRTPELSNAQQLNRLETEQIPDWREAGKFRFTFSASPELFLSNLKKTRDALDETFIKIAACIRLAVPYTGMIISTRESKASRESSRRHVHKS